MKQSTFSAVMANSIKNLLQGYTKTIRLLLVMFLTLTVTTNAWGATYTLDQASLKTSKSAYQTSDYTHTATDGSKWVLNEYGIITTSPKHIQLGKAAKNYIKTPTCSGNITKVSITFAKACSYYVAIWDMDGNKASSTVASKPAANSTTTFTISGEHKQLQVIATRTTDGTSITSLNAAAYISSITITYEDVVTETSIYLNPGVWNADGAKYAIYYFNGNTTGWSSLMTKVNDCEEIYTTKIPQLSNMTIIPVRLSNDATSGDWNTKWNQTENITFNSNYDFIQITNWGSSSDNCPYTYNSKYTSKTFTITFKGNNNTGGTMSQVTGITCKGSKTLPANTFTRTGYNFNGWNTNANGTGTQYAAGATISNITSDITLYAQWEIGTYTITLNANGGSGHTTSVTATYNSAILSSAITNPTRTGYAFKGWYSSSNGGSMVIGIDGKLQANVSGYTGANGVWTATSAKTLYAQWQILSYTVTWVVDGDETEETVNHGETVAKAPDIDQNNLPCGQKFAGWTDKPITGTTDNIPVPLYKTAAEIPAIEKAKTFYAVFADYDE